MSKKTKAICLNNFSSTATLANNEVSVPLGSQDTLNEKDYDPYEHRNVLHPNTYFGALVHLLKCSLGAGILAIPRAFKASGLAVGVIGTIFIGILCTYTIHILMVASLKMCKLTKKPALDFSETIFEIVKHGPKGCRKYARSANVAQVAKWCISLAVFFTFMLMFYVPIDITWRKISGHISEKRHNLSQFSLRTGIVIFATCIAIFAGEHLGPLIELVGAIFLSTLGLMVPAIMDTLINWDNLGCFYWKFWKNLVISIFGLFGAVAGSYYAILSMVNEES
ncbi:unnamed protein product [Brassicogethes aeneus]|uniref:Amino acid transporter transmembrane domain-containing protein n=1 Tax=Brassicogethes aeneus TaxID=1431903 RepID=A0A9P0BD77_BRAAE|nr:unnamed protein product [Brassicogethes aeneus]